MVINEITDLNPSHTRAIIINHNTRLITLLSLLSTLKYTEFPVLLIDCDSTDGSFEFFSSLKHNFDLLRAPLNPHGKTLDWLFAETKDERLLLIDSDLELLNSDLMQFMNLEFDKYERIYGAGFLTKDGILKDSSIGALYRERPFMPIVLYRTAPVKSALKAGISFSEDIVNNEFTLLPKRFYWTAKRIFKKGFRKKYAGVRPPKVIYDTGARMHEYLKKQGYRFSYLPFSNHVLYVTHYWGATRKVLSPNGNWVGENVKNGNIEEVIKERLKSY